MPWAWSKHKCVSWGDINGTFDGKAASQHSGLLPLPEAAGPLYQKNRDHPKIYFGKFHHFAHVNWHDGSFKNTCPPNADNNFRNADYQFWAISHLHTTDNLKPNWNWGQATGPAYFNICTF
ncbi:hypothetical protein GE09DRAFT_1225441 [Coniochaeta sp. 2T2.1]|nr:hypothetical protein GE09DRAFT_1225441 [Coniochaeta sp. 2T2.1]